MEVFKRLKDIFNCEAMALQQGVRDAACGAAGDVQRSLAGIFEVVEKDLGLTVDLLNHNESVRSGYYSAFSSNYKSRRSQTRFATDSGGVLISDTPWSSAPAPAGAANLCGCPGRCQLNVL